MLKFIVISDLHIVPEGCLSNAIDTSKRLATAIQHINSFHDDADFCIVAGDLTDKGDIESFRRLQPQLQGLNLPVHITLGNHDDRANFLAVFDQAAPSVTGFLDTVIDCAGHRVILLDTLHSGQHPGWLEDEQLSWLSERLAEAERLPVIVVMHHNIADLQVSTDVIRLRGNRRLTDVLRTHADIRSVLSGHVHLASSGMLHGIPFSTCAGCHYNIEPRRQDPEYRAPRREGPGQYAVVWSDAESTVVLQEDFHDRHQVMPPELFRWA
ncbi:MAG: phosphodiesterase [Rhodobacteraceae bacterium]|nr:phosphodiesterase [Paracoccaceae bacterium]